jgi:hypothetical protein
MLVDAVLVELQGGKTVDRIALEKKWREHEKQFANAANHNFAGQPAGNYFALSRELFKKYSPLVAKLATPTGQP